jgi:hypothetical protein
VGWQDRFYMKIMKHKQCLAYGSSALHLKYQWIPRDPLQGLVSFPWKAEEGQKTFNVKTDPSKGQTVLPKVLTGSTNLDELGGLEKLFCRALNHFCC